jgi:hypothetical protein
MIVVVMKDTWNELLDFVDVRSGILEEKWEWEESLYITRMWLVVSASGRVNVTYADKVLELP